MNTIHRCALVLCYLVLAACAGLFNFGSTNADGTPKTNADAMRLIREVGDAGLITYGSAWLSQHVPGIVEQFDSNRDGRLTIAELEAQIDLTQPGAITTAIVIAIELIEARKAAGKAARP